VRAAVIVAAAAAIAMLSACSAGVAPSADAAAKPSSTPPASTLPAPAPAPPPTTVPATTVPATTAAPTTAPTTTLPPPPPPTDPPTTAPAPPVTVTDVVDGDTVDVSTGARIRVIGIDAPEVGACGADQATRAMEALVLGKAVALTAGARDDVDRYGRLLRYVDVDGGDAGLSLIQQGLAIARYDSRDGYGGHPREQEYVAADAASPDPVCAAPPAPAPAPAPVAGLPADDAPSGAYYANCDAARAAGVAPLYVGEPGYRPKLDRDRDGVACE
jgi:endonuclease YncB( thermonuclease family)